MKGNAFTTGPVCEEKVGGSLRDRGMEKGVSSGWIEGNNIVHI